ncbi:helix-turn-helix domain-containing protein [Paenibacillus spongiae]|uniref:Helix-turn-helix domain-containing protein n=1 Tax=Paenibacillus spongiae TaxID=2909671 RepID=A0ABY5S3D0_9BACL|nr:helix-turn-helix transcriptional regulator [Paenibacillus spongiae]UVI28189.1 helix-turn-helix domain-containing protein [Paenibacillus spongiae]
MTAGMLLKTVREKAGISQEKLARLLHRTQSCISKIEQDKKTLDVTTFVNWTKITNASEAGIAFLYGIDPATIMQSVLQVTGAA